MEFSVRSIFATLCLGACFVALVLSPEITRGEELDLDVITRIRDEGFRRSQVMETLTHLTDVIGGRITGSPAMTQANEWTRDRLAGWGLEEARLEAYEFGRGWSFERCSVHALSPQRKPLIAYPQAWTPGTEGVVRGEAFRLDVEIPEDLEEFRGQLGGKVVFLDENREVELDDAPRFRRHDPSALDDLGHYPIPDGKPSKWRAYYEKWWKLRRALASFLVDEGAVAMVDISSRDHGIVRVTRGGSHHAHDPIGVPGLQMAAEHYNWVLRRLEAGDTVELELEIDARFHTEDMRAFNTIAELPGSSKRREVVLLGAHLDSWHAGSGATDNASGCSVMMEALRILRALDLQPARTIRVALWSGEEQGFLGSRAYVEQHLATRPAPTDSAQLALPVGLRKETWPISPLPDHERFCAYFNVDNGGGKLRGIYAEENAAAAHIFEQWLSPFHDLGANQVTMRTTSGTDHIPFNRVGLPGFQFIQDPLEYMTRTHHTHLDVRDHIVEDDLKQAAVIVAAFAWHAANRDALFPRKAMPQPPIEEATADETKATAELRSEGKEQGR
jgi:hypothetical protein